jgi:hypothetical protein
MEGSNFHHISQKKEYMELRLKLENSMILFFAYDENDKEGNNSWWNILKEINSKYQEHVKIVLVIKFFNKLLLVQQQSKNR